MILLMISSVSPKSNRMQGIGIITDSNFSLSNFVVDVILTCEKINLQRKLWAAVATNQQPVWTTVVHATNSCLTHKIVIFSLNIKDSFAMNHLCGAITACFVSFEQKIGSIHGR